MRHLSNLDLNKNEIQNVRLQNLAAHPSNPVQGQMYYNTAEKALFVFNGTVWKVGGTGESGGMIAHGDEFHNVSYEKISDKENTSLTVTAGQESIKYPTVGLVKTVTDSLSTAITNGLANKVDKVAGKALSTNDFTDVLLTKLNGIADGATNYSHPANHPPSIITQDASNRFVTDAEKTTWNAKASTAVATTSVAGLMSATDKTKLDGIAANANNYTHPANHPPSIITQDASNRFVTDAEKAAWNAKQTALGFTPENLANKGVANGYAELDATGKIPSGQLPSFVDDVLEFANFAALPASGESGKIYVTIDDNKTFRWSGSAYAEISASLALGTTSTTAYRGDHGLAAYNHSQTAHAPSTAQKNSDITKAEIEAKLTGEITTHTHAVATTSAAGYMSATDKTKLDGVAANANNYTHPANHPPSIITQDASNRFVTDAEKATWNAKASTAVATTSVDGLMSAADKTKLNGIATNANNYVHPNHTGDVTSAADGATTIANNVVTNAKLATVATATIKGRVTAATGNVEDLTAAQVRTLLNVADGANNYSHPANHPPSIITQDASNRFVTDTEKSTWNAKSDLALGTTSTTAYRGDHGLAAYNHSQAAHAPSTAQKNSDITKAEIEAKLTGEISTHTHAPSTRKHGQDIGNGTDTSFVITHNFNTRDLFVAVREAASPYEIVYTDIEITSVNTVTVMFATPPTASQYRVIVIG